MNTPSVRAKQKAEKPPVLRKDGKPYVQRSAVDRFNIKKQIKKWIMIGKPYGEVIQLIQDKYGYKEESACVIYTECNKDVKEYLEQHKEDILNVQIKRMEQVIDDTYEKGDYKTLLSATDQLNKLAKLYEQKVKVEGENFNIKIGE